MGRMTVSDDLTRRTHNELQEWYANEARYRIGQVPSRSALLSALIVLERMRSVYPITQADYITAGGQLSGINKKNVERIFHRFEETRPVPSEAGRTTRAAASFATGLVNRLATIAELSSVEEPERIRAITLLQHQVVKWFQQDYLDKERIKIEIAPQNTFERMIGDILKNGCRNPYAVAQHLVGAKLALRYPEIAIDNYSHTAGDQQTGRAGDFFVGTTAFHVTMTPTEKLIDKCHDNLRQGYRVYLLVPSWRVEMAKGLLENAGLQGRVSVESSIESFVGQNLDEMSNFEQNEVMRMLSRLLQKYNERVDEAENDKSLQFDVPDALLGL